MSSLPQEHVVDAHLLNPDFQCDLFEVILTDNQGTLRFWNGPTRSWQGNQYNSLACQLTKEGMLTDGQKPRPELSLHNPDNQFTPFVQQGYLEGSTVIRYRVLADNLANDRNIFERRVWTLVRVTKMSEEILTVEMRAPSDGPNYKLPARTFTPPDFPAVSIR